MKRKEFLDKEYPAMIKHVKRCDSTGGQIERFFKWCFEKGFMDNLTMGDLIDFYGDTDRINLPLLRNNGITIGIDSLGDYLRIGVDPSRWFDKVGKCSIVIKFPITSKREEERIYRTLEAILDRKSERSRNWFRESRTAWYGAYLSNAS